MSSGVTHGVLRSAVELEALAPAWRELWHQDQSCTPFQSPEWLIPWWHHFGNGNLRAVTIRQNGVLTGLLPLYLYRGDTDTDRRLLLLGVGTTDYLDGVFASTCQSEHIKAALNLVAEEEDWDVLNLSQLRSGSRLLKAVTNSVDLGGVFETESCSRMGAAQISHLPQKIRRNTMYYRNRAIRSGALELTVADDTNCAEGFKNLVRLHTERWQQRGCAGVLADLRVLAWHREALPLLAQSEMLRLYILRLGGDAIGVIYSLVDSADRSNRTQYFYLTGYSTDHSDLRPGTISIAMAIEDAFNNGVHTIDMLRGDEDYKRLWHLERHPTYGFSLKRSAVQKVNLREANKAA